MNNDMKQEYNKIVIVFKWKEYTDIYISMLSFLSYI